MKAQVILFIFSKILLKMQLLMLRQLHEQLSALELPTRGIVLCLRYRHATTTAYFDIALPTIIIIHLNCS